MLEIRQLETENQYKDTIIILFESESNSDSSFLLYFEILKQIYDLENDMCFEDKLLELYDIKTNIDQIIIEQKKYFLLEFELINMRFFADKKKYLKNVHNFLNCFLTNMTCKIEPFDIETLIRLIINDKNKSLCYKNQSIKNQADIIHYISIYDSFHIKSVYTSLAKNYHNIKENKLNYNNTRNLIIDEPYINLNINSNKLLIVIGYNGNKITLYELVVIMLINEIFSSGYSSILNQIMREEKQLCYNIDSLFDMDDCKIKLQIISSQFDSVKLFNEFKKVLSEFTDYLTENLIEFFKDKLNNYRLENISLKEKIKIDLLFNENINLESKIEQIKELINSLQKNEIIKIYNKLEIRSAYSDEGCLNE